MGSQFSRVNEDIIFPDVNAHFHKTGSFQIIPMSLYMNKKQLWRDVCSPFHWKGHGYFTVNNVKYRVDWEFSPVVCALRSFRVSFKDDPKLILWEYIGNTDGKISSGLTESGKSYVANIENVVTV